jgi:hypothetical protein
VELEEKLPLKPTQSVAILRAPADVDLGRVGMAPADGSSGADAVLAFVVRSADLAAVAEPVVGSDLNRDRLARLLIDRGWDPVRPVAVDATWSALRFKSAFRERGA